MADGAINPGDAPLFIAKLVDQFCAMPPDFSDIPVLPESADPSSLEILRAAADKAASGAFAEAYGMIRGSSGDSFEFDYLRGKILFASGCYYEAAKSFEDALIKFGGYGEAWFYLGMANYQMGLPGRAFMEWSEALRANPNHQDARLVLNYANVVMTRVYKELNPEAEPMIPLVGGKGIDVGCGGAKTHPDAIGVDIIPPGMEGWEASQKGIASQADVFASGDDLRMFADGELDYVIARHNLEHYVDPVRTLREWARVLRRGGVLGLVLPDDNAFDTIHADPTHKHVFTQTSLRNMVELIPEFQIAEQGVCQNKWSFYAVIQKVAPGEAPSYPYRERLNEWLAKGVARRAEMALMTGVNDVAAAALRKLAELLPGHDIPADPCTLHPFPFKNGESVPARGEEDETRVAIMDNHPVAKDWAAAIEKAGCEAHMIPFGGKDDIDWQTERRIREIGPRFVACATLLPSLAETLANMKIPCVFWAWDARPGHGDSAWRRTSENTYLFHPSLSEAESFKKLGLTNARHLPLAVDTERFTPQNNSARLLDVAVISGASTVTYNDIMSRFKSRLMSQECSGEDANTIFEWIRRLSVMIDKQLECPGEWKIPEIWNEAARSGAPPGFLGMSRKDIEYALGDEVTARRFAKTLKALPLSGAETTKDIAKVNLLMTPAYVNDIVPSLVFEILARGGFLLADRRVASGGCYEAGVDFACYDTPEEALDLVRRHLDNPQEREAIARSGHDKTVERHTMGQRWDDILKVLRNAGVLEKP